MGFDPQQGSHESKKSKYVMIILRGASCICCGLGSHIEVLNIELFLLLEKLDDIFIDFYTIFELITILSVSYAN